jgi:hypothetical protein
MARFSSDRDRSGRARRPGRSSRVRLRGHEQRFVRGGCVSAPGASVQATILNPLSVLRASLGPLSQLRASLGPTMVLRDRGPGPAQRARPTRPTGPPAISRSGYPSMPGAGVSDRSSWLVRVFCRFYPLAFVQCPC